MAYPSTIDSYSTIAPSTTMAAGSHRSLHNSMQDQIVALETKVGVNSSAVATSLDYLVKNTSSSNPGHKHTLANGATDVTSSAAELNILDGATLSTTELNYVDGVTSAIQTQLDAKVDENVAITGATKTKITYDAKGLVTAGADATTADIADSTDKRYVTDADLVDIGNLSGTNTGDQDLSGLVTKATVDAKGDILVGSADNTVTRLPAGTDGQILESRASEATGLKWIPLPTSVSVTTKGDLQTYSTTPDRLPVGTNGQVLQADSTQTTGLKWADTPETTHVLNETPTGSVNDSNTSFTLSNTPASGSLRVYLNGVRQKYTTDYTLSGLTISFVTAPQTGDILLADYFTTAGEIAQGSTSFIYDETPSGTVNGSNTAFTLANTPVSGTLQLYRDGQLLKAGGADYTLSGTSITFVTAPATSSVLTAFYQQSLTVAGNSDTVDGIHASDYHNASGGQLTTDYQGWQKVNETWTYASASTITIATGGASRYQKGDRIKWTQTTVKYGVVVAVADTLLTIAVNTDYTVANATISEIYVSREASPFGFPNWFTYTPTYTGFSADPTHSCRYSITGNTCSVVVSATANGTSNSTNFTISMPVSSVEATNIFGHAQVVDNGSAQSTPGLAKIEGVSSSFKMLKTTSETGFTASGTKSASFQIFYKF